MTFPASTLSLDALTEPLWFGEDAFVSRSYVKDQFGSRLTILSIDTGVMRFTLILERGLDIGEIFVAGQKHSWERSSGRLLHPDNVDLRRNGNAGWEDGFYGALTALGPEIFGTPDNIRTVHGTGSYSLVHSHEVVLTREPNCLTVEACFPIRGYELSPVYQKRVRYQVRAGESCLLRQDCTTNLSAIPQVLDDGFHIQLAGGPFAAGGRLVLPVSRREMLLRDAAAPEADPLRIYPVGDVLDPIRCYQYVPHRVDGLERKLAIPDLVMTAADPGLSCELLVNDSSTVGAFVVRALADFPRSLIAKRSHPEPMYAIEPCKTRPNSLLQKQIDGELAWIDGHDSVSSWLLIGYSHHPSTIAWLEACIRAAC